MTPTLYYNRVLSTETTRIQHIREFLSKNDLLCDEGVKEWVVANDGEGEIYACGGIAVGGIIKCVAIDPEFRGEGLFLNLVSDLIKAAHERSYSHLFVYSKLENVIKFSDCGFFMIERSEDVALMENSRTRFSDYIKDLSKSKIEGTKIGSIVMNANPFTNGHLYLVQTAAEECDWVHLFMVKEDLSFFSFSDRYELVRESVKEIPNLTLHEGSDYIISRATFPNYFLKDKALAMDNFSEIDLKIFRKHIAPALGITRRYVGEEINDSVTRHYNENMFKWLEQEQMNFPPIKVVQIKRKEADGKIISASFVRELLKTENFEELKKLVPPATYNFLKRKN